MQIGLDPLSQQLVLAALTASAAAGLASWGGVDLAASVRPEPGALLIAGQLSLPVLAILAALTVPKWGRDPAGTELERLRQNYFMTAQVLRLYFDTDDDDGSDSGSDDEGGFSSSSERARVKRRLRLDQSVSMTTLRSGLALLQAFQLQPWNPPTPTGVVALTLAGRTLQQLAVELLVRGAVAGLAIAMVKGALVDVGSDGGAAGGSGGLLLFSALAWKAFGGLEAPKLATGALLLLLSLPGAFWEARAARNFVRASVVGPVRDAAIFCRGDGVNEPAYCDPQGFAFLAARRPANAAPVADVVTRTKSWRSSMASASGSSLDSASSIDADDPGGLPETSGSGRQAVAAGQAAGAADGNGSNGKPAASPASSSATTSSNGAATAQGGGGGGGSNAAGALGATISASSAAFEEDSEDLGVLLRVETLQDKVAFWATAYYQILCAFAVNGAFLAADCNIVASFGAAWLLRTAPLVVVEVQARARAAAASRGSSSSVRS